MIEWITDNLATLVVVALILSAVAVAVFVMIKNRKKGSCGCACSGCPMADRCKKTVKKHPDVDK